MSGSRHAVNEDGNAGGQGLEYPGAAIPKQPILYVEIPPVLNRNTQSDWIDTQATESSPSSDQQAETRTAGASSFPSGGYFVQLTLQA